jgi:hypothetical protein
LKIQLPHPTDASHRILFLLYQTFAYTLDSSNSKYHSSDYRSYIKQLKYDFETLEEFPTKDIDNISIQETTNKSILELYRLGGLLYLNRISDNFSGQSSDIDIWTDKAFLLLERLNSINQPFPLFIFGCEAKSERKRGIILDLIWRSEEIPFARSLKQVSEMIQLVWVQDDLSEGTLDYRHKLDAIFSSMDVIPSLT